jgi:thiamine pyrophosphate-dependent acetolactate synthase large subunit-like protein
MALVSERIAGAIAAAGTEFVSGLLSSSNLRIVSQLVEGHGIPFYNVRHEAAAVGMADGYARTTGRVGVGTVTQGPGFTNALTPLITAERGSSPIVLFAGDSSTVGVLENPFTALVQGLDQEVVLAALGIPALRLAATDVERVTAEAFGLARRRRGPVVVLIPAQLAHRDHTGEVEPVASQAGDPTPAADAATVGTIAAAADIVAAAHRPVILAGRGAVEADAGAALAALGDKIGALLASSVRGAGLFAGHPFDLGIAGGFTAPAAAGLLRRSDCVLAFGASLNPFTLRNGLAQADARIIHCDADPGAPGRFLHADLVIVGDARHTAERLLRQLRDRGHEPTRDWREEAAAVLSAGTAAGGRPLPTVNRSGGGTVDPRDLCARLNALLPPGRIVVTDSGYSSLFPVEYVRVSAARDLHFMVDFGAVGSGIGPAMGAALGRPGCPVALFIGDGGLMMTLGELDTAQRYQIPILIVCLNDQAYGAEVLLARKHGLPPALATFAGTRDLVDVARSIGVDGRTVRDLAQLEDVPVLVRGLTGPYLLDCRIPTVASRVHE